jgi:hypothetical protein
LLIPLLIVPAFAQPLSDKTGLKTSFEILVDGKTFAVEAVSNFDIRDITYSDGRIGFDIQSMLENNLGELQIPRNVTKGNLYFYLDGQQITPKVLQNDKISFVTLEFVGNGTHTLEITSDLSTTILEDKSDDTKFDQITVSVAVVSIVIAAGVGSTVAFYVKRKSKLQQT